MLNSLLVSRALPADLAFAEAGGAAWQQVLATGSWIHPTYGRFSITVEDLAQLKTNFDAGAREYVYADYDHGIAKAKGDGTAIAAGEVKAVELRANGTELWVLYEPTEPAREKIAKREYRFTSADIVTDYRDKVSGRVLGKVLRGFALTNSPYIEGMQPLTLADAAAPQPPALFLSEGFASREPAAPPPSSSPAMKKIAELLGLQPEATEAEIESAVVTLSEQAKTTAGQVVTLNEGLGKATGFLVDIRGALTLSDETPDADVVARVKTLAESNATLAKQAREARVEKLLAEAKQAGKITPATEKGWRTRLLSENADVAKTAEELLAEAPKVVALNAPAATPGDDAHKDREQLLDERIAQLRKDKPDMTYSDALILAERQLDQQDRAV